MKLVSIVACYERTAAFTGFTFAISGTAPDLPNRIHTFDNELTKYTHSPQWMG